jgi:hypothetical protein
VSPGTWQLSVRSSHCRHGWFKIVVTGKRRNHERRLGRPAKCGEVARASQPRRPADQYSGQTRRIDRLRLAHLCVRSDHVSNQQGAGSGAQSRVAQASVVFFETFAAAAPGARDRVGRRRRHVRVGGARAPLRCSKWRFSSPQATFSSFDPTTISQPDRRFGGNFALRLNATGCIPSPERRFEELRTCERNVQIGDVHRGRCA